MAVYVVIVPSGFGLMKILVGTSQSWCVFFHFWFGESGEFMNENNNARVVSGHSIIIICPEFLIISTRELMMDFWREYARLAGVILSSSPAIISVGHFIVEADSIP